MNIIDFMDGLYKYLDQKASSAPPIRASTAFNMPKRIIQVKEAKPGSGLAPPHPLGYVFQPESQYPRSAP